MELPEISPRSRPGSSVIGGKKRPGTGHSDKSFIAATPELLLQDVNRRDPRTFMDPQQKGKLDLDLERLKSFGEMKFTGRGLISFNRFMHLFIIITRHSKEQYVKEIRKIIEKRRRAFRLKAW